MVFDRKQEASDWSGGFAVLRGCPEALLGEISPDRTSNVQASRILFPACPTSRE